MARRRSSWDNEDDDDIGEEFDFGDDDDNDVDAEEPVENVDDEDDVEEEDEIEAEEEVEEELPPDNQDAVRALKELGARVDLNEQGRVWRVFLYEKNKDNAALQIHGFPMLREIWLLGSKVSPQIIEKLREAYPKARIFA